ncbi:MAG: BlaR1 family beta-lactam sensor/signal transducer, partial [Lachnospiraceae bacterium]|nr:BlaR1 family beta-lactam sensor/signal transducer [Lachnospiraceae bacterium]
YPEWNQYQNLDSAMKRSVNWYFQELDRRADWDALKGFYRAIEYGNCDLSGGVHDFWLESSLRISAVEQVELLRKLCTNEFDLDSRSVQAVKDSLKLSVQNGSVLFGKTGTGIVNGKSVNGWFVGYVESDGSTWFFATNIRGTDHADSLTAAEITRDILAAKQIFPQDGT